MFNNRKVIIIGGIVLAVALIAFVFITSSTGNPKPTPSPSAEAGITYTGADSLTQQGATNDQIDDLKFAIYKFAKSAKTVTITNAEHAHSMAPDGAAIDSTAFNITIDQASYKGNLFLSGLESARLVLKDPQTGAQLYDSGVVKVKSDD